MTTQAPQTGRPRAERWAALALVLTSLLAVFLVTRHVRPYVHAQGIDAFGLFGWLPDFLAGFGMPFVFVARNRGAPTGIFARGSFAEGCFWTCAILWGMEVLDLLLVGNAFDPGDMLAALLGVGLAWTFHRALWTRRFPERGS